MYKEIDEDALLFDPVYLKQKEYWKEKLSGDIAETDILVNGQGSGLSKQQRYKKEPLVIPDQLSAKLKKLSKKSDLSLYILLLAACKVLIYRYSGNEDIIVLSPLYREKVSRNTINNHLLIRDALDGRRTFKELLFDVRQSVLEAYNNQDYPFDRLLEFLGKISRKGERHKPLSHILCSLNNIHARENIDEIRQELSFSFTRTTDKVNGDLVYDADAVDNRQVRQILNHFARILQESLKDVNQPIKDLSYLSEEEKKQLIINFNDNSASFYENFSIHHLVRQHAEAAADRVAIVSEGKQLTYGELHKKSGHLAVILREIGVRRDKTVGILMDRSLLMAASILATWKAGGAYIPLDPGYPVERIIGILNDAVSTVLITGKDYSYTEIDHAFPGTILNPEEQKEEIDQVRNTPPDGKTDMNTLAYTIYTSGSTGKPKGAMVEHTGMMNHISAKIKDLRVTGNSIVAQNSNHTFDISVWQFFTALVTGGKTIIYSNQQVLDPRQLVTRLMDDRVTILEVVPSYLSVMLDILNPQEDRLKLEYLLVTGEEIKAKLVKNWFEKYPGIKMVNAYGPTEASDDITHSMMDRAPRRGHIPIGKPLQNLNIYIVDNNMQLCPIGVKGEILVAGVGVGRGYLNDIEKTVGVFTRDPFSDGNKRLYKTGDIGRWLTDGTIEFFGRKDSQVKIRGFRIELGEIENNLLRHQSVKEAVVLVKENEKGIKYLCAYFVPAIPPGTGLSTDRATASSENETIISKLKRFLLGELPDYIIPSYFIPLEAMPLTPNGKVDRKVLPEPVISASKGYVAPRSEVELQLVKIWSEVLGLDGEIIGIDSDFFELGGNSLNATIMAARINKNMNVTLPLAEVFKTPRIIDLAGYIQKCVKAEFISIEPTEKKDYYPMSSTQRRLYTLRYMDADNTAYNMPMTFVLEGYLEQDRLKQVFKRLIKRHESFRTSFHFIEKEMVQAIHENVEFEIAYDECGEENVSEIVKNFEKPFDLSRTPLLRVGLIHIPHPDGPPSQKKNPQGRHILMMDTHHIISDGFSMRILEKDFISLYEGEELPDLKLQYRDYSQWQNREKPRLKQQEDYWIKEFAEEVPILDLPTDFARPMIQRFEGNTVEFEISAADASSLKTFALKNGATLFMVFMAIYNIFLSKLSSQEDIIIGSPVAARRHTDLEKIIGMFVNTLAFRHFPGGEKNFIEFLGEVKKRTLEAYENQEYQFEDLVEKLSLKRDTSRNPLFDVAFTFDTLLDDTQTGKPTKGKLKANPHKDNKIFILTSKFDFSLHGGVSGNRLDFLIEYSTSLFKKETIEKFITYFKKIVSSVVRKPGLKLRQLEIISEEEKKQVLYGFNDSNDETTSCPKNETIHQLFEKQAQGTPDNTAVVGTRFNASASQGIHITYAKLNEQANQVAHLLRQKGIQPDGIVGLMTERSIEMIIGILGILKAGGAYLPIEPEFPRERIHYMLKDSNARIWMSESSELNDETEVIRLSQLIEQLPTQSNQSTQPAQPTQLSYIIYTSGTTGKPKGVLTTHRNVIRVVKNTNYINIIPRDRVLQLSNYAFDGSVFDIYGALLNGSTLILIEKNDILAMDRLSGVIKKQAITVFFLTTALFNTLVDLDIECLRDIRKILFGGERVSMEHSARALEYLGKDRIIHVYGPTETTVYATYYFIENIADRAVTIPIGKPISLTTVNILDRYLRPVPTGINGEVYIGGAGLARGYLNSPELTAGRFIDFSLNTKRLTLSTRLYRTGDLARQLPDGNIEFLGRIDSQVKIRGYRIELGEIESCLSKHSKVKEALVLVRKNEIGNKILCAYVTLAEAFDNPAEMAVEFKSYLSILLPNYMIPSYFVQLETLPITTNGKIDKKTLPKPLFQARSDYVMPGTPRENKVAGIWKELLGIENVGIDDNFFELGGNSVDIIQLGARLKEMLQIDISAVVLFRFPTIRTFLGYLDEQEARVPNHKSTMEKENERKKIRSKSVERGKRMMKRTISNRGRRNQHDF